MTLDNDPEFAKGYEEWRDEMDQKSLDERAELECMIALAELELRFC